MTKTIIIFIAFLTLCSIAVGTHYYWNGYSDAVIDTENCMKNFGTMKADPDVYYICQD